MSEKKTIPFEKEAVKAYLDRCITYWRKLRGTGHQAAEDYIDAFQSVRITLFGELLPEDKVSDGNSDS